MYKHWYSRFLAENEAGGGARLPRPRLHFAAHSHHYWPDVTRAAALEYWDDTARHCDDKWAYLRSEVIPEAQRHVAAILDLPNASQITFAPNTHELVTRLLSCFDPARELRVLTTNSEFHSFARQISRQEELPTVQVERIPSQPFSSFEARFCRALRERPHDLVYFSHVFFDSGHVVDFTSMIEAVPHGDTMIVVDGYHGFCAIPTSLASVAARVFYLAGGYKYAQSGEGASFLAVPAGCELRPLDTGWFATFGALEGKPAARGQVAYPDDAFRFWGATFDPSGLYRLNAVMRLWRDAGLTVTKVHQHVRALQRSFLEGLRRGASRALTLDQLLTAADLCQSGHFLTFEQPDARRSAALLREQNVITDVRGDRIRFGFGLYHDQADVDELLRRLETASLAP